MQEEFARIKPTLPAGQLPILEADGVVYNQSKAIEQYAARISGLYPADLAKALVVDVRGCGTPSRLCAPANGV
jgi:glutathione S-transferase